MDIQLVADEENQDRAERGEKNAGWMKALVSGANNQVGDGSAKERSNDAKNDCPRKRQMNVHDVLRNYPCEKPNNQIPEQVKHTISLISFICSECRFTVPLDFIRGGGDSMVNPIHAIF